MKTIAPLILAVLSFLIGCSKSGNQSQASEGERPAGQSQEAKSPDNLLRIQAEMLRDLRITTRSVEQRWSGDGVNLLGEVTVNEEVYSQVGAPIPARVMAIAVSPGQQVSKGQQLAILQSTELGKARAENIIGPGKITASSANPGTQEAACR